MMPNSKRKPNSMLPTIRLTPKKPKAKPAATENINWSTAIIWLFIALTVIENKYLFYLKFSHSITKVILTLISYSVLGIVLEHSIYIFSHFTIF